MKNLSLAVTKWMASGKPGWNKAVAKLEKLQIPGNSNYAEFFMALRTQILYGAEFERMLAEDPSFKKYSLDYLAERNRAYYADILPTEPGSNTGYDFSFGNPDYSVKRFGKKKGQLITAIAHNMHTFRHYVRIGNYHEARTHAEFFFTLYGLWQKGITDYKTWHQAYLSLIKGDLKKRMLASIYISSNPEFTLYRDLLSSSDFKDVRYLFRFGIYVDPKTWKLAQFIAKYPQKDLRKLAKYHVQAFQDAFKRKNYSYADKQYASVGYPMGMERLGLMLLEEIEKLGLTATIGDPDITGANEQYNYDNSQNSALYYSQDYAAEVYEVYKDTLKKLAPLFKKLCGGVYVDTFGKKPFMPVNKTTTLKFSPKQDKILREQQARLGKLYLDNFPRKNTAGSMISFPHPEIGEDFEAIFKDTLELNYLDSMHYAKLQENIISLLDQADYVHIKGVKGNKTDIKIKLHPLKNPKKETNFENCVADMNIPVGEVFTSPQLKGTNGVLHVGDTFLNELRFYNLKLSFKDGMVTDYSCTNFASEEENKRYIYENIFEPQQTLPMGEFAIGTNTKAYLMVRKYKIEYLMPVLIIEKMGPHFAIGDTCFSHEEDEKHFGLISGKQMVATENEFSAKRKTDPLEAYTYKHTDITLPYDMLAEITAVKADGTKLPIIKNRRFVVPGTEELNKAIEEAEKL